MPGPQDDDDPAEAADAVELFVAELVTNSPFHDALPATYCVDGLHYIGSPLRLGRVNLVGAELPGDATPGTWAIARGTLHERGWFEQLEPAGPCPEDPGPDEQWRSDWTADEGGFQTTRAALEAAPWLEVTSLTVLDRAVLDVERPAALQESFKRGRRAADADLIGAVVEVRVRNPFDDRAWTHAELRVGYESTSHGKPMPFYESYPIDLDPGATTTLEVPARIERERGQLQWTAIFSRVDLRGGQPRALGDPLHAD